MKKRVIAPIALVLALLFVMCSVPAFAYTEQNAEKHRIYGIDADPESMMLKDIDGVQYLDRSSIIKADVVAPLTYNEHDVECVRNFLEQETNGVKNGLIINPKYDPDDPSTYYAYGLGARFNEEGNLVTMWIQEYEVTGTVDLSNCTSLSTCIFYYTDITSLNVSGCTELRTLNTSFNYNLDELIIENNPNIVELSCQFNYNISEIDITEMPNLQVAYLGYTPLKSLDASKCPRLSTLALPFTDLYDLNIDGLTELCLLHVKNTNLSSLDASSCMKFTNQLNLNFCGNDILKSLRWKITKDSGESYSVLELNAEGNGGVGSVEYRIEAYPHPGAEFVGWYENGELFSTEKVVDLQSLESSRSFTAVFEGGIELSTEASADIHRMRFLFNCYSTNGGGLTLQGILMNPDYDQYDISTWTAVTFSDTGRIVALDFDDLPFMGLILLRDMTALRILSINNNTIEEVRLFNNPSLEAIYANGSSLTTNIDFAQAENLRVVQLNDTMVTSLDLSSNPLIEEVLCTNACVNEAHLAAEAFGGVVDLFAVGNGYIDIEMTAENGLTITAEPTPGESFYGWRYANGTLLSSEACISLEPGSDYCLKAMFELSAIPGDANGDGAVSVEDALLVIRYALGMLPEGQNIAVEACDINNDGKVDAADAMLIMRLAMNIGN